MGITATLMQDFGFVPGEGSTLQLGTVSRSHPKHSLGNYNRPTGIFPDAEETARVALVERDVLETPERHTASCRHEGRL
jgi:hypothetical protein